MSQKFSIEQIEDFQKLTKRLSQLEKWDRAIADEQEKLQRQKRHLDDEKADIQKKVKTTYKALNQAKSLFSTSDVPDTALDIEATHYVTTSKKELLLDKILADFQLLNPKEKTCSFQHVKKELSEKYDIETRTISNFFNAQLQNFKLAGGNRNRSIVLKSQK